MALTAIYLPCTHYSTSSSICTLCVHASLNLSPENIRAGKFNVCLEYHIKNCAGPCIGKQSQEEYLKNIAEIKEY